jgi:serine/threonine protein kinase
VRTGSGGQADVYRAVRVTGGVSSAPMTVKVFRIDPRRPLADELRSWDKGDAVLMDLNNRGVSGICRRSDGFYGPSPHPSGARPGGDAVPYQVYEYLHGVNLREYVTQRATWTGPRVNGLGALRTLVGILRELHDPQSMGATPVLHMDIKPTNIMVLAAGAEVRLIDFTGARYWRSEEITQVAYTPESGGPEAFDGVRAVSPAYDVHGFGAVAYYLVTGSYPRVEASASPDRPGSPPPPWSVLRHNPMLDSAPRLRDHLCAPVADRPGDRPQTRDLGAWVERLGELVRAYGVPDTGVDWHDPRAVAPVSGGAPYGTRVYPQTTPVASGPKTMLQQPVSSPPVSAPPVSLSRDGAVTPIRGRATVPPPRPRQADTGVVVDPLHGQAAPPPSWRQRTNEDPRTLKLGWEYSGFGAAAAFVCWGIWAASNHGNLTGPLITFALVLAVGVFGLSRLLGRLILVQRMGRTRRTARVAHAVTGLFLVAAGLGFLRQTPWVIDALTWIRGQF